MTDAVNTPVVDGASSTEAVPQTAEAPAVVTSLLTGDQATQPENAPDGAQPDAAPADADKAPDGEKPDEAAKPDEAPAPVEYTEFQYPEGVKPNDDVVSKLTEFTKEKGLSQDDVQKILDLGSEAMLKQNALQTQALNDASKQWETESNADKEFGGVHILENLAIAKAAMDEFASPQLKTILAATKLGNNPEVIRLFFRIGKSLSEDTVETPADNSVAVQRNPADILYGPKPTT